MGKNMLRLSVFLDQCLLFFCRLYDKELQERREVTLTQKKLQVKIIYAYKLIFVMAHKHS